MAQSPQGATMTVLSGEVGVLRANGSAVQPAPSGLRVSVGDQVATLGNSGALVTFFEGTELEMAAGATVVIREVRSSGNEVHITVENVVGGTLGRVTAFVNPNSSYTLTTSSGQVVALIRGSEAYINQGTTQNGTAGIDCPTVPCLLVINGQAVQNGTGKTNWIFTPDDLKQIVNSSGNPLGGSIEDGGEPDEEEQVNESPDESDGDESSGGFRSTTPLTAEVLRTRLEGGLSSFSAAGSLLALGMIGWTFYGHRRRDE